MKHSLISKLFNRAAGEIAAPQIVDDIPDTSLKPALPADWQDMNAAEMKALAEQLTGFKAGTKAEAREAIEAHLNG